MEPNPVGGRTVEEKNEGEGERNEKWRKNSEAVGKQIKESGE